MGIAEIFKVKKGQMLTFCASQAYDRKEGTFLSGWVIVSCWSDENVTYPYLGNDGQVNQHPIRGEVQALHLNKKGSDDRLLKMPQYCAL